MKNRKDQYLSQSEISHLNSLANYIGQIKQQSWSYSAQKLQYCLQVSDLLLKTKSIYCINNELCFQGNFMYLNGKNFAIPSAYQELFIQVVNKNAENIQFCTQMDRNQLLLKYAFTFDPSISSIDKINKFIDSIQKIIPTFQKALSLIGLKQKFNLSSFLIKKQQLKLKQKFVKTINSNKISEGLDKVNTMQEQNCSVFRVKQVIQAQSEILNQSNTTKKGGYFQVTKKKSFVHTQSGEIEEKQLAWKIPHNNGINKNILQQKIQKQIKLVSKILHNKYLLNYYVSAKQPTSIYMDYVPTLLKDKIQNKQTKITQMLCLAEQLVEAVAVLHKSQLVHRDLKPENILIQGQSLKIIDYAESAMVDQKFVDRHFLGCTLPYSPIQCFLGKQEGFNKKQIDLWSLAFILYEMTFKTIPVNFSFYVGKDIIQKWRSGLQFSIYPIYRKRNGLRSVQQIMSLLTIRGIQVAPESRLSLKTFSEVLKSLKQFYESFQNYL